MLALRSALWRLLAHRLRRLPGVSSLASLCTPRLGLSLALRLAVAASVLAPAACSRSQRSHSEAPPAAIVFIENDYARALSEARKRGLPLFVDAWAPWCHTCLSMRSYVFPDPKLSPFADRFVWLALDTEREDNAPIVTRLGVKVLPTLFVIDAVSEEVRLAHPGSLMAGELAGLLDGVQGLDAGAGEPGAIVQRIAALGDAKRFAECVTMGADEAPRMPPGTPLADVLRDALGCASVLPADAPARMHVPLLVATGERVAADTTQPILADDRSDLYDYLVDALRSLGRDDEAKRLASAWVAFLDDQAAQAPSPGARVVFDSQRLLAYEAVGDPARAVVMLEQSERDFPDDYNPPARLGKAYLDLGRYDDAVASLERALGRAYGPRKLRLWSLEADVFLAKGDVGAARKALATAVAFADSVPLTGSYPALRDSLAKRQSALSDERGDGGR
jgi:tetratricopeptide (TPR) repeat protein